MKLLDQLCSQNSSVFRFALFMLLGLVAFLVTHSLFIDLVPGIHYDEAWAAHFATQIASGQIGFPLEAMSPYTVPWSHFIAALFFKMGGISLTSYRMSGILLSWAGIFLIALALIPTLVSSASVFVWICAFSLPLILNHRFCIEITTFQPFCFGVLFYGLAKKKFHLIWAGIFFGMTSHILFLAPALAVWLTRRLKPTSLSKTERKWIIFTTLTFFPFLVRVFLKIPEKEKSIALLILNSVIFLDAIFPFFGDLLLARARKGIFRVSFILSIPAFLFLLFFSEGHWNILFNYGWIAHPLWIGVSWAILLAGAAYGTFFYYKAHHQLPWPKDLQIWTMFTLLMILLISTKPTSRYYETGMIELALMCAIAISTLKRQQIAIVISLFVITTLFQLKENYFEVGLKRLGKESYFSFFIPRDNSSDFIPKQDLAHFLGENGCTFEDIRTGDSRMMESLQFLSYSDWPLRKGSPNSTPCPWKGIIVDRKSQRALPVAGTVRVAEVGPFVVDQTQ